MKAVIALFAILLLLALQPASAQDLVRAPALPHLDSAGLHRPNLQESTNLSARYSDGRQAKAGRNRKKGALYGFVIGALTGGVGFATVNYAFTTSTPRNEWTLASFVLGAAVGGAAGAILGGLIGTRETEEQSHRQTHVWVRPTLSPGGGLENGVRHSRAMVRTRIEQHPSSGSNR